jgi:hypothetical protein
LFRSGRAFAASITGFHISLAGAMDRRLRRP